MKNKATELNETKVGIGGYLALVVAILVFSGLLRDAEGPLKALDLNTWIGQFGSIVEGAMPGIQGSGGSGVRNGLMQGLTIGPGVFVAVAFITVISHYGGLKAAMKILSPLLKPLVGISGVTGLPLITNLQSSDAGAALAKSTLDSGLITPKERDILVSTQFVGAALIGMLFSNGAMLFPYITVSPGVILLVCLLMKFLAGNLMRLYIHLFEKEHKKVTENQAM